MKYPANLQKLIASLMQLPGVGRKTAERFAFRIMEWDTTATEELTDSILASHTIKSCPECGLWMEDTCTFCERDPSALCVIAHARDVFAIEEMRVFCGRYHVLGGILSPMEGRYADSLRLKSLLERIQALQVKELIIALDATVEGDATALWLKESLTDSDIQISRLASGLPMGCTLDYVDGGTLARAFSDRLTF